MAESARHWNDATTLAAAREALSGNKAGGRLARILPFLGPAFIACIAYMDPGNFATNISGGAKYGYTLIWVIVASNLMAMLIQTLSAKLGIATGRNLAEVCRDEFPRPVVWVLWGLAEVVAMATDLAEFLGAAIGFHLLLGIPLLPAGLLTGVITFLILGLQRYGFRPLEIVISVFVGIIAICYLIETLMDRPDLGAIGGAILQPRFEGPDSVLLASGILGATVMPHVIYLHSALTQNRVRAHSGEERQRLQRFQLVDVVIAMGVAGLINAAMLIMAAATFFVAGETGVASIEDAHQTLAPLLGGASATIFAVSLLASGLSSSTVGTMAGQVIMQGFLHFTIPLWLRRTITMLPALIAIALALDPTQTLVVSQVVLSFGIPFALVPLVMFTANKRLMGDLTNHRVTTAVACVVAGLIIALNFFLLYQTFLGGGA